jgi:hypothetical protein
MPLEMQDQEVSCNALATQPTQTPVQIWSKQCVYHYEYHKHLVLIWVALAAGALRHKSLKVKETR